MPVKKEIVFNARLRTMALRITIVLILHSIMYPSRVMTKISPTSRARPRKPNPKSRLRISKAIMSIEYNPRNNRGNEIKLAINIAVKSFFLEISFIKEIMRLKNNSIVMVNTYINMKPNSGSLRNGSPGMKASALTNPLIKVRISIDTIIEYFFGIEISPLYQSN